MAYETGIPGIPGLKSDGKGGVVIEGDVTATQHLDADGNPIGGASLPGVMSDGLTPPGLVVTGSLTAGGATPDPNYPILINDGQGNEILGFALDSGVLYTSQLFTNGATIFNNQADPTIELDGGIGAAGSIGRTSDGKIHVNASGLIASKGVGAYNTTPSPTQPTVTIQTSTITDTHAKAAIQALIAIVNGTGDALITES